MYGVKYEQSKNTKLFIKINALISHGQQTCSWSSDRQHLYPEWKGTGSIGNPQRFWTRLCWPIAIWKCRSYCNLQSSKFVCSHNQISYVRQNYYQLKKPPQSNYLWLGFFVYQHPHDTVLTSHALKFNSFNGRMCIISKTHHHLKIFLFYVSQNKKGSIQLRFLNICNSLLNTRIPLF